MFHRRAERICLAIIGGAILLLPACGGGAQPTPTSAPPSPTATKAAAPTATLAPRPANTATAAASTPTPVPTQKPATPTAAASTPTAAAAGKYGGVLSMAMNVDPEHFDMHLASGVSVSMLFKQTYNGLVQYDDKTYNQVLPELAEKWEVSGDGLVYTFHLRQGVKWEDGKPLTASDAAFSINRMAHPPAGLSSPRGGAVLTAVTKAEAPDPSTLIVTLKNRSASFLENLASDWVVVEPQHVLEAKGDMKTTVMGTGPFTMTNFTRGSQYVFKKKTDYFVAGRPYLDGISVFIIPDAGARIAALRTGQTKMSALGSASVVDTKDREQLKKDMGDKLVIAAHSAFSAEYVYVNTRKAPWSDPRIAKAISLALDRRAIIALSGQDGVVAGYMDPLTPWALPLTETQNLPGFRADKAADLAEAKRLMAETKLGTINVTVPYSNVFEHTAIAAKSQLAQIGLNITLALQPTPAEVSKVLGERKFDIVTYASSQPTGDPDMIIGTAFSAKGTRNYTGFQDAEVERLMGLQTIELDQAKRKAITNQVERRLIEVSPSTIPVFWRVFDRLYSSDIRGFTQGPGMFLGEKFDNVWLAQ